MYSEKLLKTSIPVHECKHGGLYKLHSRNLTFGVYEEKSKGFVGIREKFGHKFLFTEFHYDNGPPYGTAVPLEFIEMCPVQDLRETIGVIDKKTERFLEHQEGGKGWQYVDTKEKYIPDTFPLSLDNKELFDYLKTFEEK